MNSIESNESSSPHCHPRGRSGFVRRFLRKLRISRLAESVIIGSRCIAARRGALRLQPLPMHLWMIPERAGRTFDRRTSITTQGRDENPRLRGRGPAASPGRKAQKRGARGHFYVTTRIDSEKWEKRAGIRG